MASYGFVLGEERVGLTLLQTLGRKNYAPWPYANRYSQPAGPLEKQGEKETGSNDQTKGKWISKGPVEFGDTFKIHSINPCDHCGNGNDSCPTRKLFGDVTLRNRNHRKVRFQCAAQQLS